MNPNISKLKRNDRAEQKLVFTSYYGYVMSIALRYTANKHDAEEILNDVFCKIFRAIDSFNPDLVFKSWISRITVNASIDFIRKRNVGLEIEMFSVKHNEPDEPYNDKDEEIDGDILALINELPPQYRLVFNLYVFEDYKHKEIAEKLGISIGTSKSNYARAKNILRQKLTIKKNDTPILNKAI